MHKNIRICCFIKNFLLLLCAWALTLATPLSVAMSLTKEQHMRINKLQQEYFYSKKTFSKNMINELNNTFKIYLMQINGDAKIALHDVVPIHDIPEDIAEMNISYFSLIEIIKNNNEYSSPIIQSLKALHAYYKLLFSTEKNIHDLSDIDGITKDNSLNFKWPFQENSRKDSYFISLLLKQENAFTFPLNDAFAFFASYAALTCSMLLFASEKLVIIPLVMLILYGYVWMFLMESTVNQIRNIVSMLRASESKSKLPYKHVSYFKKYFEHLYFKATTFVENNKNQSFIKKFKKNQKLFIKKLIEEEHDFLFSEKDE